MTIKHEDKIMLTPDSSMDRAWHIGIIKFYDNRKAFGYIASNNCGMNTSVYEQDFYVNSSSFVEDSAKTDRRLVVFQWEAQGRGKRRAINVRSYSPKSEKDLELALTYYGDYEFVQLKEQRINMFNHLGVKRSQMLSLLKRQIETSTDSSSTEICNKIIHLVRKYKIELPEDKRYIFTKDYDNENRPIWEEIFALLKREEWIELLNAFPPVVLYVTDSTIISEWIKKLSADISDSVRLTDLEYSKRYLSEEHISLLCNKIEETVNQHILSIIEENKTKTFLPTVWGYDFTQHGSTRMEHIIREYLHYTSRTFDVEISECKRQVKINLLNELVREYEPSMYDSNSMLDKIIEVFKSIENQEDLKTLLLPLIEQRITILSESESFPELSKLLDKIRENFSEVVNKALATIKDSVIEYLTESIDKCIDSGSLYEFERSFEKKFTAVNTLLCEYDIDIFKFKCREKILTSLSVNLLSYASTSDYKWVDKDTANQRIYDIISSWNFNDIKLYLSDSYGHENIPKPIKIGLASRALLVIGHELDTPFDGAPKEEYNHSCSSPRNDNISFLRILKEICITDELKEYWCKYVNNLSDNDILSLYCNNIIACIPTNIISQIINDLSLEDTFNSSDKWYSVPTFKDERKKRIFSDSNIDIFTPIAQHLQQIAIEKENIALAVWLVELLAGNKPKDNNYYVKKEWEQNFIAKIRHLKAITNNNHRLSVLLWAIHLQTTANKTAMAEVFPWLPPYLQIRIVKRLFQYIADGRMSLTAHSFYDFLTTSKENLCLPLEIVFSYLKLREENPNATFTNAHMLTLLDGRKDYPEWIGIREFVEQCHGRCYAKFENDDKSSAWRTSFYNGNLRKIQSSTDLNLFIPRKMINDLEMPQDYNNKYYTLINSIIELNFGNEKFTKKEYANGTYYQFSQDSIIPLLNLARHYNIKIQWYGSKLYYTCNEDQDDYFCECRLAGTLSQREGLPFYWCGNKPCFRSWVRFRTPSEWEHYTILDFMRILGIPTDYINRAGKRTLNGYFIILSSFLKSFAKFYEHLKCRKCGKILHPLNLSNFASRSVTEFSCDNDSCELNGQIIYLNHCFNKSKCNTIIDSRDSKQCPNGLYICPKCGGCCSTENFRQRISNLYQVGGSVSPWIERFVRDNRGHWEKNEFYCYKCGKKMILQYGDYVCQDCEVKYDKTSK